MLPSERIEEIVAELLKEIPNLVPVDFLGARLRAFAIYLDEQYKKDNGQ